jgi:hypothetical protein
MTAHLATLLDATANDNLLDERSVAARGLSSQAFGVRKLSIG